MTRAKAEKAERLAMNEFDKWNDITGVLSDDQGRYGELLDIIKDAVHIGIQMATYGKVIYDAENNIHRQFRDDN